jgi:aspartate aminotransferase
MTPEISERGRKVPASPIRKLTPLADEAKRRGVRVYHLNIGQPDLETPPVMRAKLAQAPRTYAYTPSAGTAECVATLREYYRRMGVVLGADQIVTTTGGSEAILFALTACAGPGDEALVVEPFYTNYAAFATMAGVRLVPLRARGETGFHLPPMDQWKAALTPRTKLVLLCNPNNPTGTVYRRDELDAVAAFCRENGLFLVADEVYREFVYDGRTSASVLSLPGCEDTAVLVDSLSKRYSACGIRLGCLATRNAAVAGAALRMAQGRLSPPGLAQLVALGANELPPDYAKGIATEYQMRRDVLFEGLSRIPGLFLRKPEGAFYFVARLPIEDGEDFASWLLTDYSLDGATVMVAPAQGFYATPGLGRDEVRIAYVLRREDLEASVRILTHAVPAYQAHRVARLAGARTKPEDTTVR